jgi:hypothetical protein
VTEHVVEITREPSQGLYVVDIVPPLPEPWRATYASLKDARGYASGIRMVKGFCVVMMCDEANG